MQGEIMDALSAQRPNIRERWEVLLRTEPVNTPLGNPDSLVYMMDWTLKQIFEALGRTHGSRHPARKTAKPVVHHYDCPCGRNPLVAYFSAAEQVLTEALVLVQAEMPHLRPLERDTGLAQLKEVIDHLARREIEAFCAVCQHRHEETRAGHQASVS